MKKGFTLIELLAVMVIVGIVTLITVPTVMNVIKKSREASVENLEKSIKTAMQMWMSDHPEYYPKRGRKFYLTITQLKHDNYLDNKLINPKTDEVIANDMLLTVQNVDGAYTYTFDIDSGTKIDYDGPTPYIEIEGGLKKEVLEGSEYEYSNAYAYSSLGTELTNTVTKTVIDTYQVGGVDREIYVLYSSNIEGIPVSIVGTITINSLKKICINNTHNELYTVGDTYTCDINGEKTFYLISSDEENVKLIMDRNIGDNTPWNSDISKEEGPVSALATLKMLTRDWEDVEVILPDANLLALISSNSSLDEASLTDYMYGNLNCDMSVCNIAGSSGTTLGYWTDKGYDTTYAYGVNSAGKITKTNITNNTFGVRPVIVVSKDKITN